MISSYALKIIALVSMLIDHAAYTLFLSHKMSASLYIVMRSLGRLAFPIYAFLLVNGFEKTGDRAKYLARLCIFAVVSQLPFTLAFSKENYDLRDKISSFDFRFDTIFIVAFAVVAAAFIIGNFWKKNPALSAAALAAFLTSGISLTIKGCTLLSGKLNVFYTLACSLSAICVLHMYKNRERSSPVTFIAALVICVSVSILLLSRSDYGYKGLLLIILLYFFRSRRGMQALVIVLWSFFKYFSLSNIAAWCYFIGAALSAVPVLLYSGAQGRKSRVFYYFYPAHLAILGAVCHFILKE